MGKVDDNCVVLLFDVLDGEISGVDFCLIRQRQKEQLLGRERMVSLAVLHYRRCVCIIKRKGNIVIIERVVGGQSAMRNRESQQRKSEHFFHRV